MDNLFTLPNEKADFIIINNTGIKRSEITTFYWDEDTLELNIIMKSGDEHVFCFESENGLIKSVSELDS